MTDCSGHFGYVQLELPVFHAGYFKHTLQILQCICKRCSRVLLAPDDRKSYLAKISSKRADAFTKALLSKKITEVCKKISRCVHCGYANGMNFDCDLLQFPKTHYRLLSIFLFEGVVKKMTGQGAFFKIIHEIHRAKNADDQQEAFRMQMEEICRFNPDIRPLQHGLAHTVLFLLSFATSIFTSSFYSLLTSAPLPTSSSYSSPLYLSPHILLSPISVHTSSSFFLSFSPHLFHLTGAPKSSKSL
jgi:hypothetical protein